MTALQNLPLESMVSSDRLSPIETLGTRLEGDFTAEDAMKHGNLGGWNVRKWPAMAVNPETGETFARPGMFDVVRDRPVKRGQKKAIDVMGKYPVSGSYVIVQNEEHAAFLNALVEESGAHFTIAGSLNVGNVVFLAMRLPGHIMVGGVDPIDMDLLAINSHDGSMSFTLVPAPVRYACRNVLVTNTTGVIRIRHTSGAQKQMVAKAREALDITFKRLDAFQEEAERLINTTMTQSRFEEIIEAEFGAPEDAAQAAHTRAEKKIEAITELFAEAQTQEGIRDTAWAGYNALTEYADHFSPSRGEDREASRAQRAIMDPSFKNRALDLMIAG